MVRRRQATPGEWLAELLDNFRGGVSPGRDSGAEPPRGAISSLTEP